MVDHYPDGHNVGIGMVEVSAEEREIERLEKKNNTLRAALLAMKKWLPSEYLADVEAKGMPSKDKGFSPDYLNELATVRRALGKETGR